MQSEDLWKRTYRNIYELEVSDLIRLNKYRTGNQANEKTAARIEFTLRRASASIFFTTITTVVAFIATATSPLLPMRTYLDLRYAISTITVLQELSEYLRPLCK